MKKEYRLIKESLTNHKMQIKQLVRIILFPYQQTQELLIEKRLFREDFVRLSSEIDRLSTASGNHKNYIYITTVESSATLEAANAKINRLDYLVKQKEGEIETLKVSV